jgi:stearoyl-CoA desaturase (delta-9 desaturase)
MKYFIILGQTAGLMSIPILLYFGTVWQIAISLAIFFLGSCLGGTVTYHRLLAHRSWKCPKWLERLFVVVETFMITGSAIAWVAVHREHHRHCDSDKDPHSPHHKGFWKMQFYSMIVKPNVKYATDLLRDSFYKFQHKYYIMLNLVYALILASIDPFAVVYAWLVPAALVWQTNSLIITYSHKDGVPNNSTWLGLLTFGEGWHKNHHDNWRRTRLHKWDLGGIIIDKIQGKSCEINR